IHGCEQVLRSYWALDGVFRLRIGCSDDLSHPPSSSGHKDRLGLRPMISPPAPVRVDETGGPSKLAHGHDGNLIAKSPRVDVIDQCRGGGVHVRGPQTHSFRQIPTRLSVSVVIPAEVFWQAGLGR